MKSVIGYTSKVKNNKVLITDSFGQKIYSNDIEELLCFLLESLDERDDRMHLKATWNLDQFVAPLLKLIGQSACKKLASSNHKVQIGNFTLFYIPKKLFSIKLWEGNDNYEATLYDISQYYPNHNDQDAISIAAAGSVVISSLEKIGVYDPVKLTSPVAIYQNMILDHMDIPTLADMPNKALEAASYAYRCAGKAWTTAYKIGHFTKAFDYDLTSAYPSVASQLFSTKYCSYKKADHYIPCHVAFLKGTITINAPISPIIYRTDGGNLVLPIGTWDDYLTSEEVAFIKKWKLGSFKLKDGWFLTFKAPVKPLELSLQRLYAIRRKSVYDELVNRITKGIVVGIVGKMAERFEDGTPGKYFNPIWHCLVTSRVRLKVGEFIFANNLTKDLVHTSVDGVLTTKELKLPKNKGEMGDWRLSSSGSALVISSGQLFYGDKHPKGINYEALMEMIKADLDESYYGTKKLRPQTLAEAIEGNDIDNIGVIKEYWTSIDLAQGIHKHDRIFSKLPNTGRDLLKRVYNSKPLDIDSIIEKKEL